MKILAMPQALALRDAIAEAIHTTKPCPLIRRMAKEYPDVPVSTFLIIAKQFGLHPSTVKIQVARARGEVNPIPRPKVAPVDGYDHRAAAAAELERCKKIASERFNVCPNPSVDWTKKGTTAGSAYGTHRIALNEFFAIKERDLYMRTVAHEYAHCVVTAMQSNALARCSGKWSPHGEIWKNVMRAFGRDPTRCHQYASVEELERPRFDVRCDCHVHKVSSTLIKRIRHGMVYRCKKCHGAVRILSSNDVEKPL